MPTTRTTTKSQNATDLTNWADTLLSCTTQTTVQQSLAIRLFMELSSRKAQKSITQKSCS